MVLNVFGKWLVCFICVYFLISSLLNFNLPFFLCHLSGPVNCYPSISLVLCCYPSIISDLTWIVLSVAILLSYLSCMGLLLSFYLSHLDGPVSYLSILSHLGGPDSLSYLTWVVLSVILLSYLTLMAPSTLPHFDGLVVWYAILFEW